MGSSLLYISIAYYMQKGGGVQIACQVAYVLNERPHTATQSFLLCRRGEGGTGII